MASLVRSTLVSKESYLDFSSFFYLHDSCARTPLGIASLQILLCFFYCISARPHHVQATCNMAFLYLFTLGRLTQGQRLEWRNSSSHFTLSLRASTLRERNPLYFMYISGRRVAVVKLRKYQSPNLISSNQFRLLFATPSTSVLFLLLPQRDSPT